MNILEFFNSTFLTESSEAVEIFLRNASFSTLFISMMFYWIQTAFSSMKKTALPLLKVVTNEKAESKPDGVLLSVQRIPDLSLEKQVPKNSINLLGEQMKNPIIIGKKILNFSLLKSSASFQRKSSLGGSKLTNFGTITMILSNFLLMGLLIVRWKESGHFPLSNLYESLMFLSWSCTCIHLILDQIVKTAIVRLDATLLTKLIGSITSPSALFTNAFATFSLPAEMQKASPLVPALQSNWLMMHVTVMIISYSALILGSLLSIAFLILISAKPSSSALKKSGFFKSQAEALDKLKLPVPTGVNLEGRAISSGSPKGKEYGLQGMAVTTSQSLSRSMNSRGLASQTENGPSKVQNELRSLTETPLMALSEGLDSGLLTLPILLLPPLGTPSQKGTPYSKKSTGFEELQDLWKQPLFENQKQETLIFQKTKNDLAWNFDNLSYRVLGIGFPFLTIGILSGAVWANEAWGSYWSWDPKETWALLTWLIFAIYLHARITKGWQGKKPAIIASFGFVAIWVCFLGVNLIGEGLHSYGWFSLS